MTQMKNTIQILALLFIFNTNYTFASSTLVTAKWVKENLNKIVLIDLSSQSQYQKFHLPNAIYIDYNWLIKPQDGIALSGGKEYMVKVLSKLGIQEKDHIVIYDNMGNLDASRFYWELAKLNHSKVSMLDGGMVAWVLENYPVTQKVNEKKPTQYIANKVNFEDRYTADKEEVLAAIKDKNTILLDTRSKGEYHGNPKNKRQRTGHIPTALFFPWEVSVDGKKGFQQRADNEINDFLGFLNITDKTKTIIAYCNSGHRAARVFTLLKDQGFEDIKLYDASMQEWTLSRQNPLTTGKNP